MNDLYRHELRLFQNLFLPSVKLAKKERVGSRLRRRYEAPATPFQRVVDSPAVDPARVAELRQQRETLDPFQLSETIQAKLEEIFQLSAEVVKGNADLSTAIPKPERLSKTKTHRRARVKAKTARREKDKSTNTTKTKRKKKRQRRVTFLRGLTGLERPGVVGLRRGGAFSAAACCRCSGVAQGARFLALRLFRGTANGSDCDVAAGLPRHFVAA
ncbi:MAG: hypothetical protein ACRD2G_11775 [Terriglobia bacterium]